MWGAARRRMLSGPLLRGLGKKYSEAQSCDVSVGLVFEHAPSRAADVRVLAQGEAHGLGVEGVRGAGCGGERGGQGGWVCEEGAARGSLVCVPSVLCVTTGTVCACVGGVQGMANLWLLPRGASQCRQRCYVSSC